MERELIAERTRSALAFKRENGQPTSHPPLGFRVNGNRERMVPVTEELAIVRLILGLWRSGLSLRVIAAKLNQDAVPTKHGARWHHGTVARISPTAGMVRNRLRRSSRLGGYSLPTPGVSGSQAGGYVRAGVSG